jgi:YVTN family beta-propeller protein
VSSLPTGTVTFLFTDIEGSTRLVKRLGDGYGEVLAEHRQLLRAAFETHHGREIDTQGDSFFVAFARARDAVAAAVDGQRALASQDWPDGLQVRVRMGLHSGEPVVTEERYHGLGVHKAARVGAAAHGGQVLISSATRELVKNELPKGVRLRDLGNKRLKDIDERERLYQLDVEGLESEFPRLRTEGEPFYHRRHLLVGGLAGAIAAAVAIPVFALGQGGSGLASVAGNAVAVLGAQSGRISAAPQVGQSPSHLTLGDGAVWVTNSDGNTVSRVDPATNQVTQTIAVGSGPSGIAYGGGAIWVADSLEGTVSRIDPATSSVVQKIAVGNGPEGVAYGNRSVWVANASDGTITRIDAVSGKVARTLPIAANELTFGGGSLWASSGSLDQVDRIDPRTGAVASTTTVGNGPAGIAYSNDSVWVTNSLDGTVSRINPAAGSVIATISVGDGPASVAVGSDSVWVSNEFGGTVAQINPGTNAVVRRIAVGDRPQGIAVVGGHVLVGVRPSGFGHAGGTLTIRTPRFIDSIDTGLAYDGLSWSMLSVVGDGLTGVVRAGGSQGTHLVPDLAVSLPAPTDGGRTYTFQLRRNIRYSNGRPVAPADVRWTIERDFELRSPGTGFYEGIVGAAACAEHPRPCRLDQGIVPNSQANTVTFHLVAPDPEFLYKLGLPFADLVPAGTPAKPADTRPLPATGPYQIASYIPKRSLRLVRNRYFREWSSAAQPPGYPTAIDLLIGGTPNADITAVEHATADVYSTYASQPPSPSKLNELKTQYAGQLHTNPLSATTGFFFGTRVPPFDNANARRAVNYAVDRTKAVALAGGDREAQLTCQILPPDFPGYHPYCPYTADPNTKGTWTRPDLANARRLVAASGTKGMAVTVWTPGGGWGPYLVKLLDSLGYRAKVRTLGTDYFPKASDSRSRMQIGFSYWGADYPAASDFLNTLLSCQAFRPNDSANNENLAEFCDPRIDRLIAHALNAQTYNPEAANGLWAQVDHEMVDQAPWLPLTNPKVIDFISRRVGNYQYNPVWGVLIDQLWVR